MGVETAAFMAAYGGYIAAGAAAAGAAVTAVSAVEQGQENARAAKFEQQQRKRQEEQARTAALQAEADRRAQLNENVQTIQALRSGRGLGLFSPGGLRLIESEIDAEQSSILTERGNLLQTAESARLAGLEAGRRRRSSLMAGYLGAAGATIGGAARSYSLLPAYNAPTSGMYSGGTGTNRLTGLRIGGV